MVAAAPAAMLSLALGAAVTHRQASCAAHVYVGLAGHAALEVFLLLNGFELDAPVDDQERIVLGVASGEMTREEFARWVDAHACDAT